MVQYKSTKDYCNEKSELWRKNTNISALSQSFIGFLEFPVRQYKCHLQVNIMILQNFHERNICQDWDQQDMIVNEKEDFKKEKG